MTRTLESTIKNFYIPKTVMPVAESIIRCHATDMINLMSTGISEDASDGDPTDTKISKKNLATMIAGALNRIADKSNPVNTNFLVAALSLLQLSDGDDQLMTVARRLATKGMTPSVQKKIKEELDESVGSIHHHSEIHKAIDDAHAEWNKQIDNNNKNFPDSKIGDEARGTKEQIEKVKTLAVGKTCSVNKMADHAGVGYGLAKHLHSALTTVKASMNYNSNTPDSQADRIGRYLKDQRASRRLR